MTWRLHQFPLCPFSRAVRFALAEKGVAVELADARPWLREAAFLAMNPAGQTPVVENGSVTLADSGAIIEYFEETVERSPLIGAGPAERAEARRLYRWFAERFFAEVTAPLLRERMYKRVVSREPPDGLTLRAAGKAAQAQLDQVEWLLDRRRWLAGPVFSIADVMAAAQISVADYLSGVDWAGHPQATTWYSALKSRPSFRQLLADRQEGVRPPAHYDKLDF